MGLLWPNRTSIRNSSHFRGPPVLQNPSRWVLLTRRGRHGNAELQKNRIRFLGHEEERFPPTRASDQNQQEAEPPSARGHNQRVVMATRGRGRGRGLQRRCEFCHSACRPGGASVSGVLVGGEGGGRRQRQWAGLRADAPYRWGVPGRLGDAEGVAAAAVGGVCHPGNKQFLGRPVRVHPSFPLQGRHRRRPSHGGGGGTDRGSEPPGGAGRRVWRDAAVQRWEPRGGVVLPLTDWRSRNRTGSTESVDVPSVRRLHVLHRPLVVQSVSAQGERRQGDSL